MRRWHPFHRGILLGAQDHARRPPAGRRRATAWRCASRSSCGRRSWTRTWSRTRTGCTRGGSCGGSRTSTFCGKMAEKWVPRAIAWRPKKMFRAPFDSFHLTGAGTPGLDRPGAEPGVAAEDGLLRRGSRAQVADGDPEDAADAGEDEHRDGPGGGDGHAVVAPPVHLSGDLADITDAEFAEFASFRFRVREPDTAVAMANYASTPAT